MSEPGLVAIDPLALARLEATLHGIAEVYRSRAGQITDVLAGTGESVSDELATLRRVIEWCEGQRDDISRRRVVLDDLPRALPLPARTFETRAEAHRAAEELAPRLVRVLAHDAPEWVRLEPLLAEAERGSHDGAFAARLLTLLGPERVGALPLRIEQAARAEGLSVGGQVVDEVQGIVARSLLVASRHTGADRLTEEWMARFVGLDGGDVVPGDDAAAESEPGAEARAVLEGLGFGAQLARALALGLGAGTMATVVGQAGSVVTVARVVAGKGEADGWDVAGKVVGGAGSLGLFLVSAGIVATPLGVATVLGGSIVASAVAWLLGQVESPPEEQATPEARQRRHSRSYDPGTGASHFPGGGSDQRHQDGAGGVLPPNMTR